MGSKSTETLIQNFLMLAARRSAWTSKWMMWKLCKRTCKKILLLSRRCRLWLEIIALRCGRLLAVTNAALITIKHFNVKREPAKEPTKEPAKEPGQ